MVLSLEIIDQNKKSTGKTVALSEKIFGCEFNEPLIHQLVTAYLAGGRAGTRAQKSRSEVRGGGKKPWKQKGTGRARAGTIRSPLWRGGGVTFAAKPQDYTQKVNKKMYTAAMRSIFAELVRQDRILLLEKFIAVTHKTKDFIKQLKDLGVDKNYTLIVTDQIDENLSRATNNLYRNQIILAKNIDPVSLVQFEKVLLTQPALKQIEEMLG
jgi:large subunit ribosomal protein L4